MEQVEGTAVQDFDRPFETIEPVRLASPLVFSSPHSGSTYPPRFLGASSQRPYCGSRLPSPRICLLLVRLMAFVLRPYRRFPVVIPATYEN